MSLENIKIKFGKYKGFMLKDLPDDYLDFLLKKGILRGKIKFYTQIRLNSRKEKYKVTVTDSVNNDEEYEIEAYNSTHAINEVVRVNKIQCTQSFHGTIFRTQIIK